MLVSPRPVRVARRRPLWRYIAVTPLFGDAAARAMLHWWWVAVPIVLLSFRRLGKASSPTHIHTNRVYGNSPLWGVRKSNTTHVDLGANWN